MTTFLRSVNMNHMRLFDAYLVFYYGFLLATGQQMVTGKFKENLLKYDIKEGITEKVRNLLQTKRRSLTSEGSTRMKRIMKNPMQIIENESHFEFLYCDSTTTE